MNMAKQNIEFVPLQLKMSKINILKYIPVIGKCSLDVKESSNI